MKKLLLLVFFMSTAFAFSQSKTLWQKKVPAAISQVKASKQNLPQTTTYSLDVKGLKKALEKVPERGLLSKNANVIIEFPNETGEFERFSIVEASVMHPDLEAKYPGIKSYAGQGVDDKTSRIRFSVSPLGLQSMRLSAGKPAAFIEPYTKDGLEYVVYKREDKTKVNDDFECQVTEAANKALLGDNTSFKNADDATLRTYRLAVSTTAEYTAYHGGTKALALAAINTTMTRVNGIFENDFNVTMVLVANTDAVIYTNASTDPYGSTTGGFNSALQSTLTSNIGEANYDVGHLFAKATNNGNAGCIGCVCVNGSKGSGFTSRQDPEGDPFDVDYVAHEIGHQFGGNHTWTHGGNEGRNVQMEPGSGSTIMGYAGITGANTDVQQNSDPYFHAISIQQITNYIKTTSCQTNTNTGNAIPTVNAGSNYTIPKGTAFVLDGSGSDTNAQDVLTYCWEQIDENNSATQKPSVNATAGPAFRSFNPSVSTKRYFPRLVTIKTGATAWEWEAVPNVGRALNFRLTVRDNRAGGANNNSDDMRVTVNGTAGPFVVNVPNTNVTWNAGTTQSVTWNVAGTTGNGINATNVDIFLSTDGGDTYPITIASNVSNDGSHDIVVPNSPGSQCRIMVKGANNVFFDISNTNFTIGAPVACNANVPVGLTSSNISPSSTTLSWTPVLAATYDLRYRVIGTSTWITNATTSASSNLTGLIALTQYEVQVRSKCSSGSNSAYSTSVNFTTTEVQLNYCASASTNVNDEFISRVQLGTIDNASGAQFYSNFTSQSTNLSKGSSATITITPTWTGTVYNEAYAVWIDYNKDGDFTDAGEQVFSQAPTQVTPVSGAFTIPNSATNGVTRMRVSMKYNAAQTSCESFRFGEVEDYTVNIGTGVPDTVAPVITLTGAASINLFVGDTYNEQGATATDNIDGTLTSSIVTTGTVNTGAIGAYTVTYNVSDAAGNAALPVTRTINVLEAAPNTGCSAGISSYPYAEGYENNLGAWTQSTADDINWTVDANGTPSRGTGPSRAIEGSNYIYVEASGNGTGYPNKQAILTSPCYDLSNQESAVLNFNYHMFGSNNMGSIALEASNDDGATWNSIWSETGNKGNTWLTASINLSTYLGDTIQLRFNRITGGTWQADIAIDNINLTSSSTTRGEYVAEESSALSVSIYPNPVKGNMLFVRSNERVSYTIVNMIGQQVSAGTTAKTIDVSSLLAGLYIIQFNINNTLETIKFIKQ